MNQNHETWQTRATKRKKGIEALKKQYVKAELMNYHYYKECWEQLNQKIIQCSNDYEERLNDPLRRTTDVPLFSSPPKHSPWQIEQTSKIIALQERLKLYERDLAIIDQWLHALSPAQSEAVIAYVIERQCSQLEQAAQQLHRSSEAIQKATDRAISKIVTLFLSNVPETYMVDML